MSEPARKTVLVVDDDKDICDTLKELFEDEGYVVFIAHDGGSALTTLRAAEPKPSVIVLDLMMPIMDGCTVHAIMLQDPQLAAVPVVMCTADPKRAPRGVRVIQKPVKLDALLEAVRSPL